MARITKEMLEGLALTINEVTGNPTETYEQGEDGMWTSKIGNYHISYACGGASLHRMVNAYRSGGVTDVFGRGHMPKRELGDLMHAFLRGYEAAQIDAMFEREEG